MSDQTDSGLDARTGEDTQPNPDSQQTGDSKSQDENSLAGAALAEALLKDPEALEIVRRQQQSTKDRGVASANKKADEALTLIKDVAHRLGIDPAKVQQAQRDIVLDELINERLGNSQAKPGGEVQAEAQQPASSLDIEAAKKVFPNLDENDPRVTKAVRDAKSQEALIVSLANIRLQDAGKPQASPTQAVSGGGKTVSPSQTDSLTAAYKADVEALKAANRGYAPPHALAKLKETYREKGLKNLW